MKDFKQQLLDKIKAGELTMRPRWHFVLKAALFATSTVLATLSVIYLFSFITFVLDQSGIWFAPGFGWRGVSLFMLSSPWIIIIPTLILIGILSLLVRHYSFGYQQPVLYTIGGIMILTMAGTYLLEQAEIHPRLRGFVSEHEVPGLSPLYRHLVDRQPDNIIAGTIISFTTDGLVLRLDKDLILNVLITDKTRVPRGWAPQLNEEVLVFGDWDGDTVTAFGIKPETRPNRLPNTPDKKDKPKL